MTRVAFDVCFSAELNSRKPGEATGKQGEHLNMVARASGEQWVGG
jgi:hypothetical protein